MLTCKGLSSEISRAQWSYSYCSLNGWPKDKLYLLERFDFGFVDMYGCVKEFQISVVQEGFGPNMIQEPIVITAIFLNSMFFFFFLMNPPLFHAIKLMSCLQLQA